MLPNDVGTAPGCVVTTNQGKMIMMFPVLLRIKTNAAQLCGSVLQDIEQSAIYSDNIHVFGKGEGAVAEEIAAYIDGQNPTLLPMQKMGKCLCV